MKGAAAPIAAVAVVVPARDEQERLDRCLHGIVRALTRVPAQLATRVVVVLDGCRDGSAAIARRWPVTAVELPPSGVGRARAAGVAAALASLPGIPRERIWIANTDADSEVPPHWLASQLALADAGWDAVLGTVMPDLLDLPPELRDTPLARPATAGEPVYGANLGVRAHGYELVGGFAPVRAHEDVRLVAALRRAGRAVTAAYDIPVLTSGRVHGRAPGGYAGYLRREAAFLGTDGITENDDAA